jgi:TP901 family phage tail tape measure protein
MTAIWNNFDDGSKSIEYYADVITKLGAATASSAEEISTGLEKFAAIADTVGLSYEYATAALTTVTATTRQSAEVVGTAFKTLFARIQDLELGETLDDGTTLGKYSEALQKVGIDILDANGELKKMDIILNDMGSKWGSLTDAQKVSLAQTVAGTRQYTQLVALMDNWEFFSKNLETAAGATGELNKQQAVYMESTKAHLNAAQTA